MKLKMNFGENSLGNKITEVWCYGLTVTPRPPRQNPCAEIPDFNNLKM